MTTKWVVVLDNDSNKRYYEFKMLVIEASRNEMLEKADLSLDMHKEVLGADIYIWGILRIDERSYALKELEELMEKDLTKWNTFGNSILDVLREKWFPNNLYNYRVLNTKYKQMPANSKLKQQMCRFFGSLNNSSFVNGNLEVGSEALIND